jgi:O-antigen ligase
VHVILAGLVCFGILTLWIPDYWPVTVFQVGTFTLAAIAVWRSSKRFPGPTYPLAALGFAVFLGVLQWLTLSTVYAFATQTATVQWATFLAVFLTGICLFADEQVSGWFRSAMLWFGFVVAIVATLQTFSSDGKVFWLFPSGYSDYVMGPILSRNHYAAFIEAILPVALYRALHSEKDSILYSGMAAVMYASVIASASRAGTVLATGEILVVTVLMWVRGRASGRAIGLALFRIAILFVAFSAVAGWESAWKRLWAPDPTAVRPELAMSSLRMIAAHPWFGVGLGAWSTVYPHYATVDIGALANQAHNDWLQWTAEGGVPFGLVMGGLFFWCLRPAFRTVWGLGVLAVFLHALVDYPFSRPALGAWTILILAMLTSAPPRRSADCRAVHHHSHE